MSQSTAVSKPSSSVILWTTLAGIVFICASVPTFAEASMMSLFRPDAQMSIWLGAMVIKWVFWTIAGLGIVSLAVQRRKRRWLAVPLLAMWGGAIIWSSVGYWEGRRALADASNPRTSPERLAELEHFNGIKAGYELDNRLAANPNTPTNVLRELHGRKDQLGTEMKLAANPKTPQDILGALSKHEDELVRRELAENPAIGEDIIERLAKDTDRQVRERLAGNSSATGTTILR
jgi:hypothetical protein